MKDRTAFKHCIKTNILIMFGFAEIHPDPRMNMVGQEMVKSMFETALLACDTEDEGYALVDEICKECNEEFLGPMGYGLKAIRLKDVPTKDDEKAMAGVKPDFDALFDRIKKGTPRG